MPKLTAIETIVVGEGRWQWSFVRLEADDGTVGWGEGSDCPAALWVVAVHDVFSSRLLGEEVAPIPVRRRLEMLSRSRLGPAADGFVLRTAASALEQAAWDLHARSLGIPLAAALGGRTVPRVRVYANLNRGLLGGNPDDVVAAGEGAAAAGFDAMKCAPFAGVDATDPECPLDAATAAGLGRVRALRDAVPDAPLYVDAHGRFDRASGPLVASELDALGVAWLEDPVSLDEPDAIAVVKAAVPALPLAGGELLAGWHAYRALLDAPVDVVLTDVKHNGGHGATAEIAAMCRAAGRRLSLHNPAGPVAAMHSANAAATQPGCFPLEHAFSPERTAQVEALLGETEPVANGWLTLPDGPGIGIDPARGGLLAVGDVRRSDL